MYEEGGDEEEHELDGYEEWEASENCKDEESFASDFYKSGTDWSCLNPNSDSTKRQKTTLKQSNLLNCWGLQKESSTVVNGTLKQSNLFKCWGIQHQTTIVTNGGATTSKSGTFARSGKRLLGIGIGKEQEPRACPFYKKIQGTPFTVDAFRYGEIEGCSAYFLSHFHADHYGGLTKKWSHGSIYCTPITSRLVKMCLYVDPLFICPLEMETEYIIEGIKVTMLEANHCPGAALIHFRLPNGQCYLHTGDFRASKKMQTYPILLNYPIKQLFLDTTYCDHKYRFPPKEDVLEFVVGTTKNHLERHPKPLIVVGAYSIGKECVYLAISKSFGFKVYANASRRRTLQSFGWPEISDNLCTNGKETPLHVLPISSLKFEALEEYMKTYKGQYSSVLAFRPTGWTYSETVGSELKLIKPKSKGNIFIYGVPYSEHSSFTELQEFVQFLQPEKIIPTVNIGNAATRDKMQSYFWQWQRVGSSDC